MSNLKEDHERAVGDEYVRQYNRSFGTNFAFKARPIEAPDLTYVEDAKHLHIEVTTAYYDDPHARLLWETARGSPNAPASWNGKNFDNGLVSNINRLLQEKCAKQYGPDCV